MRGLAFRKRLAEWKMKGVKKSESRFALGIDFYKLFWVFVIGCFLGVVAETLYCLVTYGYIESRQGLIYGPFNPVYGFGAVLMTLVLNPLEHKKWYLIFLLSMILGGGFEYLSSYVQQLMTGTVSWQYNELPFNLGGRTSLRYSLYWGVLGLLWIKEIYPLLSRMIDKFLSQFGILVTWLLVIFMILNMTISVLAINRWTQRQDGITASNNFEEFLDQTYPDRFLDQVYPNLVKVGSP
jgi:uncharacterized membrane protein